MPEGFFTTVIFETAVLLAGLSSRKPFGVVILAHRLYISPAFPAVPVMVKDFVSLGLKL